MASDRRQKLIDLGADALADALIDLTSNSEPAENRVARMTLSAGENLKRFRTSLGDLTRKNQFYDRRESQHLALRLANLLDDLVAADPNPKDGLKAMADFFRADRRIFEICDDSFGNVGQVFTFEAVEAFAALGRRCGDEDWMIELLVDLNRNDDYDLRISLFGIAHEVFSEAGLKKLVSRLWEIAESNAPEYEDGVWLGAIDLIARKSKNARLYERARRASPTGLLTPDEEIIAKICLETGDPDAALQWLDRHPDAQPLVTGSREQLRIDIYGKLGDRVAMARVAKKVFERYRSEDTLKTFLEAIGENERERVIDEAAEKILNETPLSTSDTAFLVSAGRLAEAARYVLDRAEEINGNLYSSWTPLAEAFEKADRRLAATIAYRALLDSILDRGFTKAYRHGVRYLKKLDGMASKISEWADFVPHRAYTESLRRLHGRKRSFWKQYEG